MEINITLISVIVIVLLYIPGFFFKRFYYTGKFTKQFSSGIFAERFITSIFWGFIVQLIAIALTDKLFNVDFEKIKSPLSKMFDELKAGKVPDCTRQNFNYGVFYILSTIVIAIVLGYICHKFVRVAKLDVRFPILRFANYWNYYFKGDLEPIKTANSQRGKVYSTIIDVLVDDSSEKNKLYTGLLFDYTISNSSGELETIVITKPGRWSNSGSNFVPVRSNLFTIPYRQVLNLNIRYNIVARRTLKMSGYLAALFIALIPIILFYVPYLLYDKVGLWRTIGAVFIALLDWVSAVSLVFGIWLNNTPQPNVSNPKTAKIFSSIFFIVLVALLSKYLYSFFC